MEKKLLSDHLRLVLCEKYGNVASATRAVNLNYDRTKKSLQANKFPADILTTLLSACDIAEDREYLEQRFVFSTTSRFYQRRSTPAKTAVTNVTLEALISGEDLKLLAENALIRERVIELIKRECVWARTLLTL